MAKMVKVKLASGYTNTSGHYLTGTEVIVSAEEAEAMEALGVVESTSAASEDAEEKGDDEKAKRGPGRPASKL